jgi:hypothetical protein
LLKPCLFCCIETVVNHDHFAVFFFYCCFLHISPDLNKSPGASPCVDAYFFAILFLLDAVLDFVIASAVAFAVISGRI